MTLADDIAALQAVPFAATNAQLQAIPLATDNADPNAIDLVSQAQGLVAQAEGIINQAAALIQTQLIPPARLMAGTDFTYQYSFKIPVQYGGNGIGLGANGTTLFIGGTVAGTGHDHPLMAEVNIPTANGSMATIVQPFADVTGGLDSQADRSGVYLGCSSVYGQELLWTAWPNYNVTPNPIPCLGKSTLNLSAPQAQGMFKLSATVDGVAVAGSAMDGWITSVPPDWNTLFPGATHFVGNAGISGISNTSSGPAAFGIDATQLVDPAVAVPATPYIYYPLKHAMPSFNTVPNVWCAAVRGMFCISNSKIYGMGFVGTMPVGAQWYGLAKTDPNNPNNIHNPPPGLSGTDPCSVSEGNHSQGKMPSMWIYDPNAVIDAPKPYSINAQPISMGGSTAPCQQLAAPCATFDGVADDSVNGMLYILQAGGGINGQAWVHVYNYPH